MTEEFLSMGIFKNTHFVLQKSKNVQSKQFGVQEICKELPRTEKSWITVSFQTFLIKMERLNNFQKAEKLQEFEKNNG